VCGYQSNNKQGKAGEAMNKIKSTLAVLALLAVAASPALAQDKKYYLGGSIGSSIYTESCQELPRPCDDNDTGLRGYAGYYFNRHVALEFGFAGLGSVVSQGLKARQVIAGDASGLLVFPLFGNSGIHTFGRLGIFRARTKVFGEVEANTAWTYGAGLGYNLGFVGIRAEWQRFDNVGGGATGEDTIEYLSVGGLIRF
jgi:opacity protein-like surface antigen